MRNPKYEHIYPEYRDEDLFVAPEREGLRPDEKDSYDYIMDKVKVMHMSIPALRARGEEVRIPPLIAALLQSPLLGEKVLSLSGFLQGMEPRGSFTNREREFIEQALTR